MDVEYITCGSWPSIWATILSCLLSSIQPSIIHLSIQPSSVQFSSVAQWCPTLCDPMDRCTHARPPCPSPAPGVHPAGLCIFHNGLTLWLRLWLVSMASSHSCLRVVNIWISPSSPVANSSPFSTLHLPVESTLLTLEYVCFLLYFCFCYNHLPFF